MACTFKHLVAQNMVRNPLHFRHLVARAGLPGLPGLPGRGLRDYLDYRDYRDYLDYRRRM